MWYANPDAVRRQHEAKLRLLYACFCVSIALHGLAMFALTGVRAVHRPDDSGVLTAMFEQRLESTESRAPASEARRKLRERRPPESLIRPPEEAPPLTAPPAPRVEDPAPNPAASPHAADPAAPAPRASEPASPEAAPTPLADAPNDGLLIAYRLALIDVAKRYKRYPVRAMERGWEGRVEIRLVVDQKGAIKEVLVKTSSRYPILDDQALDMVKRAFNALAQTHPAPRGREFILDVPIIFELQTG